jgi:predicted ATP-binding protein involved in virulence
MYIDSVQIEDLRCFKKAEIKFMHPDAERGDWDGLNNVTLLLGNNGAGKTTVLRAAALAALSQVIQSSGFVPTAMVRRRRNAAAKQAVLRAALCLHNQDVAGRVHFSKARIETGVRVVRRGDIEQLEVTSEESQYWDRMFEDESSAFLMLGYGASRRVEASENVDLAARKKVRLLRYHRVAGLFEEHVTMMPLAAWLPNLTTRNPGRYRQVIRLLNRLLPKETHFTGTLEGNEYLFRHRGVVVPFGAMSDGFRAYIGWIGDLLYHILMGCPSGRRLVDTRGVVLIDEIDLHLHPEWQRTAIPKLATALPNLQLILTSHSPIVVGTLRRENVVVFEEIRGGVSRPQSVATEIHGLNADQVLTSHAFGLRSTRAPALSTTVPRAL